MKKRIVNISFALSFLILTSVALQSVHSFKHFYSLFTEKKCNHHYAVNKTIISHQHHQTEHCFSCEFTFSTYLSPFTTCFIIIKNEFFSFNNGFFKNQIAQFFNGSLFQLRAPPSLNI